MYTAHPPTYTYKGGENKERGVIGAPWMYTYVYIMYVLGGITQVLKSVLSRGVSAVPGERGTTLRTQR